MNRQPPIIRTLAGELAQLALIGLALVIAAALLLALCNCIGPEFTAAAAAAQVDDAGGVLVDAGEDLVDASADAEDLDVHPNGMHRRDAGEDLLVDASADAEDLVDAGDGAVEAAPYRECDVSVQCPVCPGLQPMYGCCHAGKCGCVGASELCVP